MKKLQVRLVRKPGQERVVGQLAEAGRQVYFEYDPAFLRDPLWLSPFKLPPEAGLVEHRDHAFAFPKPSGSTCSARRSLAARHCG